MWKPRSPDWRVPKNSPGPRRRRSVSAISKTVGGAHHGFEAGAGFVGHARGGDEYAMGFLRAAADASAKLVELGEAEALGVLDDHDGGVGDVHAHLHYSCGDEDLRFVLAEALHDFFFFVAGEAAVQEAELEVWEKTLVIAARILPWRLSARAWILR